ncbi:hypothetical protein ABH922_001347 [Rhodococcus sp. 27YEA15]|uniref:hypothetical protein n=1 Tax=Rhodococcus sp. 27YEA15 TaxID=3156259 RepID=UPI003C7AFED5
MLIDPWQAQVEVHGRILDKESDADHIIGTTHGGLDTMAARLPGWTGRTAVLSQIVFATKQVVLVADPDGGDSTVFEQPGRSSPPRIVVEAGATGGRLLPSRERLDASTADVTVLLPDGGCNMPSSLSLKFDLDAIMAALEAIAC